MMIERTKRDVTRKDDCMAVGSIILWIDTPRNSYPTKRITIEIISPVMYSERS